MQHAVALPQTYVPSIYAASLPRPVYKSSLWTSKEVYKTSHNLNFVADRFCVNVTFDL